MKDKKNAYDSRGFKSKQHWRTAGPCIEYILQIEPAFPQGIQFCRPAVYCTRTAHIHMTKNESGANRLAYIHYSVNSNKIESTPPPTHTDHKCNVDQMSGVHIQPFKVCLTDSARVCSAKGPASPGKSYWLGSRQGCVLQKVQPRLASAHELA